MTSAPKPVLEFDYSKYGFRDEENYSFKSAKGLSEDIVREISAHEGRAGVDAEAAAQGARAFSTRSRCRCRARGPTRSWPSWTSTRSTTLCAPARSPATDWEAVPETIRNTFEKLGIPEAERKFLAGVGAQYESEVVYHSLREEWEKLGVIFLDMDTALREYPEIVKEYFGTIIPAADNKFAALNTAVWSGGSFVYVPAGVKVDIPLQAYFRINAENMGQFERTLIVVEEGAEAHYIEGCTAPVYTHQLAALGGGRDHRQEGRQVPLHDDPELGQQYL